MNVSKWANQMTKAMTWSIYLESMCSRKWSKELESCDEAIERRASLGWDSETKKGVDSIQITTLHALSFQEKWK